MDLAGQHVLVLGNNKVASDLLDRRAAIYSDRPRFIVACGMLSEGLFFTFTRYGDMYVECFAILCEDSKIGCRWRKMRRVAHEGLHKQVVVEYQPVQTHEAIELLAELVKDPDNWEGYMRRSVPRLEFGAPLTWTRSFASTVLSVAYGLPRLDDINDPILVAILGFTRHVVRTAHVDGSLIDYFPWLRFAPRWSAPWKEEALSWAVKYNKLFHSLFEDAQALRVSSCAQTFIVCIDTHSLLG